jgi:polar amino acid transport system substrate-binding protein
VKKGGNPKLLATINQVLAAAHKDGSYEKIYAKWIGGKPGGAS